MSCVASNPEFLSRGTAVKDTLYNSQIVIGVEEEAPGDVLKEVYQNFDASIVLINSEGLLEIFSKYGYCKVSLRSIILKGKDGAEQIKKLVGADPISELREIAVTCIEDYQSSERMNVKEGTIDFIPFPVLNVLKHHFEDGTWYTIRPSGTEPKAKFYFGVKKESLIESETYLKKIEQLVMERVNKFMTVSI
ncbi:hypothetical protein [Priestia sp. YIM B13448]|uniref:hypothetical protein n=1 Tax=Priestia sp. YIM B13448 TaxID=3366308 RepID=UPI00366DB4C7